MLFCLTPNCIIGSIPAEIEPEIMSEDEIDEVFAEEPVMLLMEEGPAVPLPPVPLIIVDEVVQSEELEFSFAQAVEAANVDNKYEAILDVDNLPNRFTAKQFVLLLIGEEWELVRLCESRKSDMWSYIHVSTTEHGHVRLSKSFYGKNNSSSERWVMMKQIFE